MIMRRWILFGGRLVGLTQTRSKLSATQLIRIFPSWPKRIFACSCLWSSQSAPKCLAKLSEIWSTTVGGKGTVLLVGVAASRPAETCEAPPKLVIAIAPATAPSKQQVSSLLLHLNIAHYAKVLCNLVREYKLLSAQMQS